MGENKLFWIIVAINVVFLGLGLMAVTAYVFFGLSIPGAYTNENVTPVISEDLKSVTFDINLYEANYTIIDLLSIESQPVTVEPVYDAETEQTIVKLPVGVYKFILIEEGGIETETTFQVLADDLVVLVNLNTTDAFSTAYVEPSIVPMLPGTFVHPLSTDPGCAGWTWSRGYSSYHKGVDMAKKDGCWINAAGDGKVITAGWGDSGEGFNVVIDHGNGILSKYYNGDNQFKVSVGDTVEAGQEIMYLGCSGNCIGDHLHFEIVLNGVRVNPEHYVTLR